MAEHGAVAIRTERPPAPSADEILAALRQMWDGDHRPVSLSKDAATPVRSHPAYTHPGLVTDNPYWDAVGLLPDESYAFLGIEPPQPKVAMLAWRHDATPLFVASRDMLVFTFAWSIPSPGDLAFIVEHLAGRGVVEVGAGTGYWAWQLTQAGADVIAYDAQPGGNLMAGPTQYHPVHEGRPPVVAEHGDRVLLLCWPPSGDPMASDTLAAYTGDTLIYIGEFNYYCNATKRFFAILDREWEPVAESRYHLNFYGIHCKLTVFTRATDDSPQ